MGLFDRIKTIYKSNKNESKPKEELKRNAMNIQMNDIVKVSLEDYLVIGILEYNDSGYKWKSYLLEGADKNIWLSAEEDDGLELGVYERIKVPDFSLGKKKVTVKDVEFHLEEKGQAVISHKEGRAGAAVGQSVQYFDYESDDDVYESLSVEKWGEEVELSLGYSISEIELEVIASTE